MWKIPHVEVGDEVELIEDVVVSSKNITLPKGAVYKVTDVGTRHGLPFVSPKELTHELQLQPRTYNKCN